LGCDVRDEEEIMMMVRGRVRFAVSVLAAAAIGGGLGGGLVACDQVSEETQDATTAVVCSRIQVDSGEIADNPETARLVALVVRDLAPEENIRDLAAQVAEDPNALNPRAQLADYVNDKCGR
jgi:hypothetical protein